MTQGNRTVNEYLIEFTELASVALGSGTSEKYRVLKFSSRLVPRLSILFLRLQWLPSGQRPLKKVWIPGGTSGEVMTEKPPEGTRGSGQPRVLRAVILQGMAEPAESSEERVSQPYAEISSFSGRTTKELVRFCFLSEHSSKATTVIGCFIGFYFLSALSASVQPSGFYSEFSDSSGLRESGGVVLAVVVQDPTVVVLAREEAIKGKERCCLLEQHCDFAITSPDYPTESVARQRVEDNLEPASKW
ncbi:hypothetical protein PanWU01x14_007920 [Parasponia andersonii]|uniref:Uncharacterized protein n=1 Tax=Parasponia andersonii TaxID=3476 RepID=A0A2P5E480_PARAD|nr:hypothetical protein PanWU01x14_007920 [Parasponia andersonii]